MLVELVAAPIDHCTEYFETINVLQIIGNYYILAGLTYKFLIFLVIREEQESFNLFPTSSV